MHQSSVCACTFIHLGRYYSDRISIAGSHVADLANEDTPQVYLACGRGPRSSIRVLRHGLEVSEMAVSELPGNPNAVWTVKKRADG